MHSADSKLLTRTKLIATLGPATSGPERLAALLDAGVDVCRLNFSHGNLEDHKLALDTVRRLADERGRSVAVLGDLCGPKIRLNAVRGGKAAVQRGQTVRIVPGDADCTPERLTTTYAGLAGELDVGNRIYIDDGLVRLLVTDGDGDELVCTCTTGGDISTRKGVNLPDTALCVPALTEKDRHDLDWAIDNDLDYVALSFVRKPADLLELKDALRARGGKLGIIAKIEKVAALEHIGELIALADGVMVARGDLGVEMDVWRVPIVQKELIARCRDSGVPVIVATQMLQSMVESPMPTRAEVSDVANAIFDAADAVMLSAETAVGRYPIEAVEMIGRVARTTEAYLSTRPRAEPAQTVSATNRGTSAIAQAAVRAALHLDAALVAAWTATGRTVQTLARHRLPMPIVGLTYDERVYRRMALLHGVVPVRVEPLSNPAEMAAVLDDRLTALGLASPGDLIVVVTSTKPTTPGATDTTLVHRVGDAP